MSRSKRRRWPWAVMFVVALAALVGAVVFISGSGDQATTEAAVTLTTADVIRTDLVEQTSYDGTLGRIAGDPILSFDQGTITSVPAVGSTIGNGDVVYAVDGAPVAALLGEVPMYRDLDRWPETTPVAAAADGIVTRAPEAGALVEEGDVLYEVDGEPVVVLYGTVPAYRDLADLPTNLTGDDVAQLEAALERLDLLGHVDMTIDDEFTSATESVVEAFEESIGGEIDGELRLGDYLFVDGPQTVADVLVEVGSQVTPQTVVVEFADGEQLAGDDVAQLQVALIELGHAGGDLPTDGTFDAATEVAVHDFQLTMGLDDDGSLELGEVTFLPRPVRVADVTAGVGSSVSPGSPVLTVTGEEMIVTMNLPAADQGALDVGDAVTVELLDGSPVGATVDEVATVATVDAGEAAFAVEIVLSDTAAIEGLDEAPVEILVVTDSVEGVTAVPVSALVVLREGGYAVEVVEDGGTPRLVAVEPGFFSDGLVEITGTLEPGDVVVVP